MGRLIEAAKREIEVLRKARRGFCDVDFYQLWDRGPQPGPGVRRLRVPGKDVFGQRPNCK